MPEKSSLPTRNLERQAKLSSALKKNLQRRKANQDNKNHRMNATNEVTEKFLAIGLMSGTSLDGIDASLIETDGENYCKQVENFHLPYSLEFQQTLRLLTENYQDWLSVEQELTKLHASCVEQLLQATKISKQAVKIIGFHGQTIYHNPASGLTWQIGNPHLLLQLTSINVISDFRRRDIACGGQGAPLVPVFHKCLMQAEKSPVAVLNIGGVANITYIASNQLPNQLISFDTGPGNALINDLARQNYNLPYDDQGQIAATGTICEEFVEKTLKHSFFYLPPPKSLDRNSFISIFHDDSLVKLSPQDQIATLTYFTVKSICAGIKLLPSAPKNIYFCGGGAKNITMINWLNSETKMLNSNISIANISAKGWDQDFIESQAFAYLAVRFLKNLPGTFPSTTGTNKEILSGILYPL